MKQIPLLKISLNLYHANMCWEPILEKVAVETIPSPPQELHRCPFQLKRDTQMLNQHSEKLSCRGFPGWPGELPPQSERTPKASRTSLRESDKANSEKNCSRANYLNLSCHLVTSHLSVSPPQSPQSFWKTAGAGKPDGRGVGSAPTQAARCCQ